MRALNSRKNGKHNDWRKQYRLHRLLMEPEPPCRRSLQPWSLTILLNADLNRSES